MFPLSRTSLIRFLTSFLTAMLLLTPLVQAQDLPAPSGKVLLRVDGLIAHTSDGQAALFDARQLEALGMHKLVTSNPFIEGTHTFEGPLLSAVLDLVGAKGDTVQASALDGYNVDLPIADARTYPVIVAMKMDGKAMRVRTKGPLWIIYPVDQYSELKAESYSGRSIWQLTTITVK